MKFYEMQVDKKLRPTNVNIILIMTALFLLTFSPSESLFMQKSLGQGDTCDPTVTTCEPPAEPPACDPTVTTCEPPADNSTVPADNSTVVPPVNSTEPPIKQFCDPSIETCDPNAKSKMWAISPTLTVSTGKIGAGVQGVHFKLINLETGVSKTLIFVGVGLGLGTSEFTVSNPSITTFTSTTPLSFDDFDTFGSIVSVGFTPGIGASAACASFKGLPTDPSCIDIGGLQVGFGLGASAIGGRFVTVGSGTNPPPNPPQSCDPTVTSCP